MKGYSSKAALGLLAAIASVASASDVTQLKKDTFEPFLKDNDLVLAEFFAPWCGHCKQLAPEYEKAATELKDKGIQLAKIDCTEEADLCTSQGVEGYPTLKVFRGPENSQPYNGQRKADSIASYMIKQSLPSLSTVSPENLDTFKASDKIVVVGFFEADDVASNQTLTKIADAQREKFLFGGVNDASTAKKEGVTSPGLILYKKFDEGKAVYSGSFETKAIEDFIKVASVPLIGEVGPETYSGYMAAGIPLAYIFAETAEERETFAKELKPIAQKHKGKINLATLDAKQFGQHGSNLNLEVGKWPAFAIQDIEKNTKYPMDQTKKLTEAEVGKFVDDFVAGKLSPSIKSEPVPAEQSGPVTVVVAKNYDEIVKDSKKDVLLEFYAPWCGHCKSLAPKYEQLAQLYSEHGKQVVIAKVDATANDVPDEVTGFPTIKLYPASNKESPVEYEGSRTVADLAKFIFENGSHKVEVKVPEETQSAKTESMQEQAPAATEGAEGAAEKVKEAAKKVAEAVTGGDEGDDEMDEHDEL